LYSLEQTVGIFGILIQAYRHDTFTISETSKIGLSLLMIRKKNNEELKNYLKNKKSYIKK